MVTDNTDSTITILMSINSFPWDFSLDECGQETEGQSES